ncbi:hypothetical protein HED60_05555 [Planctomycetales bacterium ZRK34]|nr:hypothetical protein HED60_05555 [Planctomycetales bacterium ZRK34]
MGELLFDDELFTPISSRLLIEADYEASLLAHGQQIFSGWSVVRFKAEVEAFSTGHGPKQGDLALVDPSFRSWWVVEVELSHHSLEQHVAPQVEVLALGIYGDTHANALSRELQLSQDDQCRLASLVVHRQPKILIVVNDYVAKWKPIVQDYAQIMVVSPYVDRHGRRSYLVDGDRPTRGVEYLSPCIREGAMPRSLHVLKPEPIAFADGKHVRIRVGDAWTTWKFHILGSNAFLFAEGAFPLGDRREFILGHNDAGELFLNTLTSAIRRQLR